MIQAALPSSTKYPGVLSVSMRMYVYPMFELDHAVPLPPTRLLQE